MCGQIFTLSTGNVVKNKKNWCWVGGQSDADGRLPRKIKGTHTVFFSSSLYIINQKPMIPRINFNCITTWVARSSG